MPRRRRSFGRIILRGKVWYVRFRHKGREVLRAIGPSRAMADARLAQIQAALAKKEKLGVIEVTHITFKEFWKILEPTLKARLSGKGFEIDRCRYKVVQEYFATQPLSEVEPHHISDFVTYLRTSRIHKAKYASGPTANRYLALLSSTFKEAIGRGFARENPVRGVRRAREEQKALPFLSAADIDRIVAKADPSIGPLVVVAADTGLRRGELLRLEWGDVSIRRGRLVVRKSKSKRPREVPLTARAKATLQQLRDGRPVREDEEDENKTPDWVFPDLAGKAPSWAGTYIWKRFRSAATAAGFPAASFHQLRHSFCSRLAQSGVPLPTVKALAGHGSLALTSRYASHVPENAEAAAVRALETSDEAARTAAKHLEPPHERDV